MCTICGGTALNEKFLSIFTNSLDRGRDYSNVFYRNGSWICNHRAVPTTEVENAEFNQPFGTDYKVVHNGTISNDKELGNKEGMIDSYVLAHTLDFTSLQTLKDSLSKIVGSYALGILKPDGNFYLACNYKPVFYCYDDSGNFYFSSYEHHLINSGFDNIKRLPPYSVMDSLTSEIISLDRNVYDRAIVIASAGLDSTAVAAYACATHKEVTLLHYNYGCLAETPELIRIKKIQESLNNTYGNCKLYVMDLDLHFMAHASTIMDGKENIAEGVAGSEYAHEWVPARNLIMMSMAVGFAEANHFSYIYLGTNLEEGGCLSGDTEVYIRTKDSEQETSVTLQDLYNTYENPSSLLIKTMYPNGKVGYNPIERVYCTGEKPLVRITFVDGTHIDSSNEHEFFTDRGYTECCNLRVGDVVYGKPLSEEDMDESTYNCWQDGICVASGNRSFSNQTRINADNNRIRHNVGSYLEHTLENGDTLVSGMSFHPNCDTSGCISKTVLQKEARINGLFYEDWVNRVLTNTFIGNEIFLASPHYDTSKVLTHPLCVGNVIDSIESIGTHITYDVSVQGTHNYIANNVVGHNSYPDNEQQFIQDFNSCLYGAVQNGEYVEIRTPVGNLMKHEIVPFGLKYKAPFEHTWSCYHNGEKACGHCGPCFMRRTAFARNGMVDPIEYEE